MAANFWGWRRQSATAPARVPHPSPERALEQVELYTAHALALGLVAPEGQRMSDILNREEVLAVHSADVTPYRDEAHREGTQPIGLFPIDEVLLAMPPEHAGNPARQIHRKRRRVLLHVGPFHVIGTAHMPPGADLDPYVLRTRSKFVAVTDALVRYTQEPMFERSAAVVLVNTAAMTESQDLLRFD
jgi:hypothetical protein